MGLLQQLGVRPRPEIFYFSTGREFQPQLLAARLEELIRQELASGKEGVIFLCIGTDRSTGDSLGPLIGHKLNERIRKGRGTGRKGGGADGDGEVLVYGTLERPVHAMNLEQYREFVLNRFPRRVVVAVDASVGSREHIGCVTLGKGALKPGLGVSKDLCEVGDIFITGIVGGYASFDPVMLQSVRLSMVMRMADCICDSICLVEKFWDFPSVV